MRTRTRIVSASAAACALVLVAAPAAQADPGDSSVDLRNNVYAQMWLPGSATWTITSSKLSMQSGWDNVVSSLWVWSYVDTAILYENNSYSGLSAQFVYGTDDLRDYSFNDMTSSVQLTW